MYRDDLTGSEIMHDFMASILSVIPLKIQLTVFYSILTYHIA